MTCQGEWEEAGYSDRHPRDTAQTSVDPLPLQPHTAELPREIDSEERFRVPLGVAALLALEFLMRLLVPQDFAVPTETFYLQRSLEAVAAREAPVEPLAVTPSAESFDPAGIALRKSVHRSGQPSFSQFPAVQAFQLGFEAVCVEAAGLRLAEP